MDTHHLDYAPKTHYEIAGQVPSLDDLAQRYPQLSICDSAPREGGAGQKQDILDKLLEDHPNPNVSCLLYDPRLVLSDHYGVLVEQSHNEATLDPDFRDKVNRVAIHIIGTDRPFNACSMKAVPGHDVYTLEDWVAFALISPHDWAPQRPIFVGDGAFNAYDEPNQDAALREGVIKHEYVHINESDQLTVMGHQLTRQDLLSGRIGLSTWAFISEINAYLQDMQYYREHEHFGPESEEFMNSVYQIYHYAALLGVTKDSAWTSFEYDLIDQVTGHINATKPPENNFPTSEKMVVKFEQAKRACGETDLPTLGKILRLKLDILPLTGL